jgi:hypothetical protein
MAGFDSNFQAILSLISAGGTLQSILAGGNTTGGTPIEITSGDFIQGEDSAVAAGSDVILRAGNATAGAGDGGNLLLFGGTSFGGTPGIVNITGDTIFNNDVTITGEFTSVTRFVGTGSPEGAVLADSGAMFTRTDATSLGNNVYVKLTDGVVTGWAPMGPHCSETFTADGIVSTFALVSGDGFYRNVSGTPVIDVRVYWNGVRLTEGAATGDFAITVITPGTIQIRDGFGNPLIPLLGDRIIIDYLPL